MDGTHFSEPRTKGKIVIKTTYGPLEIELWSKECPKASRNFVQHCLTHYYNDTIFHRVVKNFIVQGGDPTGTGNGGESIWGSPFACEYHQRLRFLRRGLLGMVCAEPDENGSQFFFTLDRADELTCRNTLFGKIVGDTLFNLLRIGEIETENNERPLYPVRIISTDVIENPFDDIVATPVPRAIPEIKQKQKSCMAPKRDRKLLSFGNEEGDEEVLNSFKKFKSSHDLLGDAQDTLELSPIEDKPLEESPKREVESIIQEEKPNLEPQIEEMKKSLKIINDKIKNIKTEKVKIAKPCSLLEEVRKLVKGKTLTKSSPETTEEMTLKMLNAFRDNLSKKMSKTKPSQKNQKPQSAPCVLHSIVDCNSCSRIEEAEEDTDDWFSGHFEFKKSKSANVYEPRVSDYTTLDPRDADSQTLLPKVERKTQRQKN